VTQQSNTTTSTGRLTLNMLLSFAHVGPVIERTLIAELPELGTLGRKRFAALPGLAPWTRQSGKWKGKSFIDGGRSSVRAAPVGSRNSN
jgi:transposase